MAVGLFVLVEIIRASLLRLKHTQLGKSSIKRLPGDGAGIPCWLRWRLRESSREVEEWVCVRS